ncbi:MAG: aminopeptidase [Bacillota bacterium]
MDDAKKQTEKAKELAKQLLYKPKHIASKSPESIEKSHAFCVGYKDFISENKTEREIVKTIISMAKEKGYKEYEDGTDYEPGEKIYINNRNRAIMLATIGTEPLDKGMRIIASHIDSPRLDFKPSPLYEKNEIAYCKTHYYGGIKRYQWAVTPLAIHGIIYKEDGTFCEINIGENENDPVFVITDLLPHLAKDQGTKKMGDILAGEDMNIVVSSIPFPGEDVKEAVKLATLVFLNEQYGITEKDFHRAEIEVVPAGKARDIGFDRSLIGGYGQDDRSCAYTSLIAELEIENPKKTTLAVFADKEEIGSTGATGMQSNHLKNFISNLSYMQGVNKNVVCHHSTCLSADVGVAFDPAFASVSEPNNSAYINKGVILEKYTGSRGKVATNDCGAEFMAELIGMLDGNDIPWQAGELGKVDQGGGGTVARYIAELDITTVDMGVPILAMHSPFEISSKLDVYATYLAFSTFLKY